MNPSEATALPTQMSDGLLKAQAFPYQVFAFAHRAAPFLSSELNRLAGFSKITGSNNSTYAFVASSPKIGLLHIVHGRDHLPYYILYGFVKRIQYGSGGKVTILGGDSSGVPRGEGCGVQTPSPEIPKF